MARYFAEIGKNKKVIRVIVCEVEEWPPDRLGGDWKETEIDGRIKAYAGVDMYDSEECSPPQFVHEWVQPVGSEDAYPQGAWIWHNGRAWHSMVAANVWEPGVSGWREYGVEWPEFIQPTGAHDAYLKGEKITWEAQHYVSLIDANVWTPAAYPPGWHLAPLDQPAGIIK